MSPSSPILTISAHADDHVMHAGTLFKLIDQGYHHYEALLTNSNQGRDWRNDLHVDGLADLRQQEFLQATSLLGTKQIFEFHQPDLNLQLSTPLIMGLVEIIRQLQPVIVFIHNQTDWHKDHIAAHQISREAIKLAASGIEPERGSAWSVPQVLAVEGAMSIQPQILSDVTDYAAQKMTLWKTYASQATPEETAYIESLLYVRGYQLRQGQTRQAEAFNLIDAAPLHFFN